MPWYAYPSSIMAGASVVSGALAGRSKKQTTTSKVQYSPEQEAMQRTLLPRIQSRLENPSLDLAPLRTATTSNINRTYDSLTGRMERALTQRGFGRGGKMALNTRAIELARAGELSDLEAKLAMYEQDYRDRGIQEAMQFAYGAPAGSTATSTMPGRALASGVGGGIETMMYLLALSKMLQGGGGGGGIPISEVLGSGWRG